MGDSIRHTVAQDIRKHIHTIIRVSREAFRRETPVMQRSAAVWSTVVEHERR